jgi:hypothetical protein
MTTRLERRLIANQQLDGVGDASLGEWIEENGPFVHLRRRLNREEEKITGPVVDIRSDSSEVKRRLQPIKHLLPVGYRE